MNELVIGSGAGFAGDRYEPAVALARSEDIRTLVFECLAERTIAIAQQALLRGESPGFDSRLLRRLSDTLPHLLPRGARAITNGGAANPAAAAHATLEMLDGLGLRARVAAVTGDNVRAVLPPDTVILETGETVAELGTRIVSANAYMGAEGILRALDEDAQVIITGRVGDASLFTAPILHHFGRPLVPDSFLAEATLVGHMLECAGQLTGGYFDDAAEKQVPRLAHLGFPFARVNDDGAAVYSKLPETGGRLDSRTALEQLYYEISDPSAYVTPDVTVNFVDAQVREIGVESVSVGGATAVNRPAMLKVSIGVDDGYMAIAEITYVGRRAAERSELAARIVLERWADVHGCDPAEVRVDYVGLNSARPWHDPRPADEVRLRVSHVGRETHRAITLCDEVEALYTNGPAGGGGVVTGVRQTTGILSALIPRELVEPKVEMIT